MIQTTNLTRHFGTLAAVKDLNMTVEPGELFGFLGPNGAGKTTTIRMLVGLLSPTSGSALVAKHDIQQFFFACQVVFWVGVRALWKAAIRRLERVEV